MRTGCGMTLSQRLVAMRFLHWVHDAQVLFACASRQPQRYQSTSADAAAGCTPGDR